MRMAASTEIGHLVNSPGILVQYPTSPHYQFYGSNWQSINWATVNRAATQNMGQPITNTHGACDDTSHEDPAVATEWQRMQVQLFVCAQEGRRDRNHPNPRCSQVNWDKYTEWTRQIWAAVDLYRWIKDDAILNCWEPRFDEMDRNAGLRNSWDILPPVLPSMECDRGGSSLQLTPTSFAGAAIWGLDEISCSSWSPDPPLSPLDSGWVGFEQIVPYQTSSAASPPVHVARHRRNEKIYNYPAPPRPSPISLPASPGLTWKARYTTSTMRSSLLADHPRLTEEERYSETTHVQSSLFGDMDEEADEDVLASMSSSVIQLGVADLDKRAYLFRS
jgi:hypothetical protein